jgi:uncharacterized protein YcbK (DUF882 family)
MTAVSRRTFLQLAAGAPFAFSKVLSAAASPGTRAIKFVHTHTGERLDVEFFSEGVYHPDALVTVNHFLRDFRTGDVHDIDSRLLDLLHSISSATETRRPFEVISGYRSPVTNEMLRHRSEGVAANSLHLKGQAIDIRLTDVPLDGLRRSASALRAGGVGYYPASNFVHVDTGRVRFW